MVREILYKGYNEEKLKEMPLEEFAKLTTSRARRSIMRIINGKNKDFKKLMKKIENARKMLKEGKFPKPIRTHLRDTVIIPQMLGLKFAVHNGKEFVVVTPTVEMLGHYLGEFALTRKRVVHGKAGVGATRSSTAIATRKK